MIRYVIKRILLMIPVLLGVAILIFTIMYFVPGDPAEVILGSMASEAELNAMRESLGLNDPYIVRLGRFLYQTFIQFDFGTSYIFNTSVASELAVRFPRTLFFAVCCMVIRVAVGTPLGITAAVHHNGLADRICMMVSLIGISLPEFWVALMLVIIFALNLGILPVYGIEHWYGWILPVVAGSLGGIAGQARQTRSQMLEVIRADYVTTARAKGLSERAILYKTALPNGVIPLINMVGSGLAQSLGGALIIENVFTIPGMGVYLTTGVNNRDYPVVQSTVLFLAFLFSIIMLLVDLAFAFVDPRIKAQYERSSKKMKKSKKAKAGQEA
ncbi:MAG: ABC transporter permease [Clostridiales bacterium]|nr:ABC transporter permease [Clostridiales bacterium]